MPRVGCTLLTVAILVAGGFNSGGRLLAAGPADKRAPRAVTPIIAPHQALELGTMAVGTLTVSPAVVSFLATNPATDPLVAGVAPVLATLTITGTRPARTWTLTLAAQGPTLNSGSDTIPVDAMNWTATGQVLSGNGTVNPAVGPQALSTTNTLAASGSEGNQEPFQAVVTLNFTFTDSWSYSVGIYSQAVLFTLTAP